MATDGLPSLQDELTLLVDTARQAGVIAMRDFGNPALDIEFKDGDSPVTRADFAVDTYLRETLTAARPDYGWLSEETADTDVRRRMAAPRTFIADPIDGTRAFIDGYDIWCVSVAVVENGRPVAGVLECPARSETVTAVAGGGAQCNGASIATTPPRQTPLVGGPRLMIDRLQADGCGAVERYRHVPSLAYRLFILARGGMDATFVKPKAADWDIAAADLIVHEAGGLLTDASGAPLVLNGEDPLKDVMIAAHPDLHGRLLAVAANQGLR